MEVFAFNDYREYLSYRIKSDEKGRGYQKKLALAAECQSSYLSQVLMGSANLTLDQAMGLCQFWEFDSDESDYFLSLVQWARSGKKSLRSHLEKKMDKLRVKRRKLSDRFKEAGQITQGQEIEYYSTWYLPVIHTMVSVPKLRKPEAIAKALNLELNVVEKALNSLKAIGLVEELREGWTNTARSIHLKSDSPLNFAFHSNIRQMAARDIQKNEPGQSIHYSAIHSLSERDFDRLKEMMISLIERSRSLVADSKEETAIVFGLDFFRC